MTDKEKIRAYIIARMDDEQEAVEEFDRLGAKESAGVQRSLLGNNAGIVSFIDSMQENPAWSEEDDYNLQCMIAKVASDIQKGNVGRNNELIDWLKALKGRVQPQQKQEWSEEDESMRIMKLIDKDAVVAAIDTIMKKQMNFHKIACINGHKGESCSSMIYAQLEELLSFINTLEVKEVDLDKQENNNEWKNTGGFGSTYDPDSPDYCPD